MVQCPYKEVCGREMVGEGTWTHAVGGRIMGPFGDDKEVAEVVKYVPKPVTLAEGTLAGGALLTQGLSCGRRQVKPCSRHSEQ